ncbi:hypothetical protein NUBL13799_12440 [Klebsiella pneumoniae]|nr:hypothetical protein NUBL13784_23200 [Klebsiella pneumoniae]GKJ06226.1 hypothetical protein NUBL21978_49550 [Klebsiella pneumoniae]GKJ94276.1 hypothetical protein NUBL9661_15790 [Klebsiella pneumoniae]GKL40945.1 hypothetical protein NUBL13799_12440 [Klebsiella pneumoniae]GKN14675.1 hypothetical protein NUBL22000_42360 [Klebsiella pneumoniae]
MGKTGKSVRPEPRRVGKHQRLIHPDKPVQIFVGARAGSALRQVPRAPEASTSGDSPSTPHRRLRPMSEKPTGKATGRANPLRGRRKIMLLKWKPPQIVNGKDDDSQEAVIRFMKDIDKSS